MSVNSADLEGSATQRELPTRSARGAVDARNMLPVTIVIPTYRRESVLINTITDLLSLRWRGSEILVLDQTEVHSAATADALSMLDADGSIRWIRIDRPSIPHAMNRGLLAADHDLVLFLDDDIRPDPFLVRAHTEAHLRRSDSLIAGRVIQPWQEGRDFSSDEHFHFACCRPHEIREFMGGNFSVRRSTALAVGGFDENFVRVAYRFEAEFAHRFRASGRSIWFEPEACLHHLKDSAGGTRTYGEHLTTWRPDHAVGAYYFALRTRNWSELAKRPLASIVTRFHLRHPWKVFSTLVAEARGLWWALRLHRNGPNYIGRENSVRARA